MSFEIGKTFRFEAAHCLKHHDGKCSRPHGHSYEFEIIVERHDVLLEGPKAGMVADYSTLSEVGRWIEGRLDHLDLNEVLDSDTTTAEELSRYVWEWAKARLPNLVEVRFRETAKTFASYRPQRKQDRRAREAGKAIMAEIRDRLYEGIDTSDPDACWEFTRSQDQDGYGWCAAKAAGTRKAHRVAAWLAGDDIEGRAVLHLCDNPPCVNPTHLYTADHTTNEADKDAKKRRPVGEAHGAAKLTELSVRAIVAAVQQGQSRRLIAEQYGVSTSLVNAIMQGRAWRHVTKFARPA